MPGYRVRTVTAERVPNPDARIGDGTGVGVFTEVDHADNGTWLGHIDLSVSGFPDSEATEAALGSLQVAIEPAIRRWEAKHRKGVTSPRQAP